MFSSALDGTYASARNYDVRTPDTDAVGGGFLGLQTNIVGSFSTSDDNWRVAELIPDSSINNVKSIQLRLKTIQATVGSDARANNTDVSTPSTKIRLASGEGSNAIKYNGRYINIYSGSARFNTKLIVGYNTSTKVATVSEAWDDNGYGAFTHSTSDYIIGAVCPNFEINDITIVYRPKRVK